MKTIICKECGERKHRAKGLCHICYCKEWRKQNKDHQQEYDKEYRKNNKTLTRKWKREWYKNNPQKVKEMDKTYYKNHKEEHKERSRQWRQKHPEQAKKIRDRWKEKNPEKYKLIMRKAKSKRRLIFKKHIFPQGISTNTQIKIFERDKICVYCNSNKHQTIDHIISVERGGLNNYNNLVLACQPCNCSKQDKGVFEWCKEKGIEVPKIVIELLNNQTKQTQIENDKQKNNRMENEHARAY